MRGRSRLPRSATIAAAALAVALLTGSPAHADDAGTIVKTRGNVQATLSWDAAEYGIANPHLKIERAGAVALDASIADICPEGCVLVADRAGQRSILQVIDLDGDREPEVIVDTYSGGAHCCTDAHIYDFRAAGATYGRVTESWGNGSYVVKDLGGDGKRELVGADDRFAYQFSSYADSAFPPRVLRYRHVRGRPRVEDITRRFGARVRSDARRLLRTIRRAKAGEDDVRGVLAAYVADQYLLRRGRVGLREVSRALERGLLDGDHAWPYGTKYRGALLKFLRRTRYVR